MEHFKAVKRTSPKLRKLILKTLETHEKYKSSYLWRPSSSASGRRYAEKNFPISEYSIETKEGLLTVNPNYKESCNNIYYSLNIQLGDKKKSIRSLKQLINDKSRRMKNEKIGCSFPNLIFTKVTDKFEAYVSLMDDKIREEIHMKLAPCSQEEFLQEYKKRHLEYFKEEFQI